MLHEVEIKTVLVMNLESGRRTPHPDSLAIKART